MSWWRRVGSESSRSCQDTASITPVTLPQKAQSLPKTLRGCFRPAEVRFTVPLPRHGLLRFGDHRTKYRGLGTCFVWEDRLIPVPVFRW